METESNQEASRIRPVDAGHMLYDKCIVTTDDMQQVFIKAHNEALFTSPAACEHTLQHLRQEGYIYGVLQDVGFKHIPEQAHFDNEQNVLYLSAQVPEHGWHWELPMTAGLQDRYITDVLSALHELERVPADTLPQGRNSSMQELYAEGWSKLKGSSMREDVLARLEYFDAAFYPHVRRGVEHLGGLLTGDLRASLEIVHQHIALPRIAAGHFDARQSNIAWHPEYGVSIVDWSWASAAPYKADRTMFIIDLFKSGHDVSDLLEEHFDVGHALLHIGHWAARSTAPTTSGNQTVRFHQLASAVSAASLIS